MFPQGQQQQPQQPKMYQVLEVQNRTSKKTGGQFQMYILGNLQKLTKQNGLVSKNCITPIQVGKTYVFQWEQTQSGGWLIASAQEVPGIPFNPGQFKDNAFGGGGYKKGGNNDSEGQARGNYRHCVTQFIIAKSPTLDQIKEFNQLLKAGETDYFQVQATVNTQPTAQVVSPIVTNVPNVPSQTPQTAAVNQFQYDGSEE